MKTKTELDGQHPSSNYLVTTDPDDTSTWHLRVRNTSGQLDHKLMGDAWAALHEGFRGEKYEGPNKKEAVRKLVELYRSENRPPPGPMNRTGEKVCVYNRSDAEGNWIHIVPKGELPNRGAGIVQVLDDTALTNIILNIRKDRLRMGEDNWPGIYAGREHFIYNDDKDSEALAWFKDFEKRDDGIWASANGLTPIGQQAVQNRQYKYTSFVADRGDLEPLDGNRYRVNKIETVGFTNMANGKELLKPILNRADSPQTAGNGPRTNESGQTLPPTGAHIVTSPEHAEWDAALEKWYSAITHLRGASHSHGGVGMSFECAWRLCVARHPQLYHDAFGAHYSEDRPAQSDAEAQAAANDMSAVVNRVQRTSGMDFRFSWNFVRENLPGLFNRRFTAMEHSKMGKPVNADNYAGVQKRAQKQFLDMVLAEQERYGIKSAEAFTRVSNREPELKALANYEVTPREAFSRAPALQDKLLNRPPKPMEDSEIQRRAKRLFDQLVKDEREPEKTNYAVSNLFGAFRKVQNREPVLCALLNKEITPSEAFAQQPSLRGRIEKIYA